MKAPEKDMMTGITNVGEGWRAMIREMEDALEAEGWEWTLLQVKEKFGGLRYYATPTKVPEGKTTEDFYRAVGEAEDKSFKMCEECGGEPSVQESGYWMVTLCAEHRAEREALIKAREDE